MSKPRDPQTSVDMWYAVVWRFTGSEDFGYREYKGEGAEQLALKHASRLRSNPRMKVTDVEVQTLMATTKYTRWVNLTPPK